MKRELLTGVAIAFLIAGCSGATDDREEAIERELGPAPAPVQLASPPAEKAAHPSFLSQRFSDGRILLRYPRGWEQVTDEQWGVAFGDNLSAHPAFVAVQYLPRREYASRVEFAEIASGIVRPPAGEGTTLLYTQAARVGGRRGIEAGLMVAILPESPLGPTVRVIGIELDSGEVAILVFAAEQPSLHREQFAWIKKTIAWVESRPG